MLLSVKRTIIATCIVALCVLFVFLYQMMSHNSTVRLLSIPQVNLTSTTSGGLNPHWTTEKMVPRFAYVQYATDLNYLCNAMINFVLLERYAAEYDKVLIYPKEWEQADVLREHRALDAVRSKYPHIKLHPFEVLSTSSGDPTWHKSLTKFHAFALTDYTRVLIFDSDSMVLNNMDHYFLSPLAPVAVPRAYWLNDKGASVKDQILGSHVMLIEPDEDNYNRIIQEAKSSGDFDMEVLNHLFSDSAMILPHRRLALLTGEFRTTDHERYMAEDKDEEWNAMAEVSRAYLVHFSDWPLPKPWQHHSDAQWAAALPACPDDAVETPDKPRCADRFMWTGIYEDYYREKEAICNQLGAV